MPVRKIPESANVSMFLPPILALDKHTLGDLNSQLMFIRKRSTKNRTERGWGGRSPHNTHIAAYRRSSLGSRDLILLMGCVKKRITFLNLMHVALLQAN